MKLFQNRGIAVAKLSKIGKKKAKIPEIQKMILEKTT